MEYMEGGELQWATDGGEPYLTMDQTRRCTRDVVLGLEYCTSFSLNPYLHSLGRLLSIFILSVPFLSGWGGVRGGGRTNRRSDTDLPPVPAPWDWLGELVPGSHCFVIPSPCRLPPSILIFSSLSFLPL